MRHDKGDHRLSRGDVGPRRVMTQMCAVAPFAFSENISCKGVLSVKKLRVREPGEGMGVQQVADFLGLSYSATYRLFNRTDFPSVTIGRRRLVLKSALMRWIDAQTKQPEG